MSQNYLENSAMCGFTFLTGDVNFSEYGGKWYRKGPTGTYHIIELINMWEATGEVNQDKYVVELSEIDLSRVPQKTVKDALTCCGIESWTAGELTTVEAISSYMGGAPMGQWHGGNYRQLLSEAKRESRRLERDHVYHASQMQRPVNRLGSTAVEYAAGDLNSALVRGIAAGDKSARIIGKMHGLTAEDMNAIQGDESLKDFTLTNEG